MPKSGRAKQKGRTASNAMTRDTKKKSGKVKRRKLHGQLNLMHRFLVGAIANLEAFRDITLRLLKQLEAK
jgi:hypothetical protein